LQLKPNKTRTFNPDIAASLTPETSDVIPDEPELGEIFDSSDEQISVQQPIIPQEPSIPEPIIPEPITPESVAPEPTISEPVTSEPIISEPVEKAPEVAKTKIEPPVVHKN